MISAFNYPQGQGLGTKYPTDRTMVENKEKPTNIEL